ncbi:MAG: DUF4350 domain-containing protein [Bacteroidota bacterium]
MFKTGKSYIIVGGIALALLLLYEYNKPKQINWFPSYVATHKIPYGTKVLNEVLPALFSKTQQVYRTPYEFLSKNDTIAGSYVFINNTINFGPTDLDELLSWVTKGNHLFLAAESFENSLLDTLHLKLSSIYDNNTVNPVFRHSLTNSSLKGNDASFEKDYYSAIFRDMDTVNTLILGEVAVRNDSTSYEAKGINAVQLPFGKGKVTCTLFPEAFSNYFILKAENRNYTSGLLSYLDNEEIIYLDNHHKAGKTFYTSPMYLFLNTKELKWAYYLVLIGALLYIIFEGKRKQRAIRVITPLKNQTLAFTRTIADMYFENNKQREIAEHKIQYFLDFVRNTFYLSTEKIDGQFYHNLALRSNHTKEEIEEFFLIFQDIQKRTEITNAKLEQLERIIQDFKAKADGKQ